MSPALRYSLARITIFLLCLLVLWLVGLRDNPLILLIVATTVSMFISLIGLRGIREEFADQVAHRVEERTERKMTRAAQRRRDEVMDDEVMDDETLEDREADAAARDKHRR